MGQVKSTSDEALIIDDGSAKAIECSVEFGDLIENIQVSFYNSVFVDNSN